MTTASSPGRSPNLVSPDTTDKIRELHDLNFKILLGLIVLHVARDHLLPPARAASDQADDHRRAATDPAGAADAPRQMVGGADLPRHRIAITRWMVAGAPPF